MKTVEQFVSPLVENLFPSFYRDEGQDFVAFIKAYYEWIEQHFQWATVDDASKFSVGDTLTQVQNKDVTATGTIYSIDGNVMLIQVTSFAPFRCRVRCNILSPIINSSGEETYIVEQSNVNPLYHSRNLFKYRDIDSTIDQFILQFKEKYLKNIQFNIATNKQLLVKNALSLYRAKGTERATDLFFRLVYNIDADVYYPGDDIFRASDGDWYVPKYIEITQTSRSIDYVGKTITGMSSGATAFVEKFIKRKAETGYTHVFYINNISGTFEKGEALKTSRTFSDAPKVLGSLNALSVISGGSNYNVGDIVDVIGNYGAGAQGRVTATETKTGEVDFIFVNGGYGYSTNPVEYLSEKTLTISDITANGQYFLPFEQVTQSLINVSFSSTTTNTFTYDSNVYSYFANGNVRGVGRVIGSTLPVVVGVTVNTAANNTTLLTVTTGNTIDMAVGTLVTGSSNLAVVNTDIEAEVASIINSTAFTVNSSIIVANGTSSLAISSNGYAGEIFINILEGTFPNTTSLYTPSNAAVASINSVSNKSVSATIIKFADNLDVRVANAEAAFAVGAKVYQSNGSIDIAEGTIISSSISGGAGIIQIGEYTGVFDAQYELALRANTAVADVTGISTSIAVEYNRSQQVVATINSTANATTLITISSGTTNSISVGDSVIVSSNSQVVNNSVLPNIIEGIVNSTAFYVTNDIIVGSGNTTLTIYDNSDSNFLIKNAYCNSVITNTSFIIDSVSLGSGADYSVVNVNVYETVIINTDYIYSFANTNLNATSFQFPKSPSANISSYLMGALTYNRLEIGSIEDVITTNPGLDYTSAPIVAIRENDIASLNLQDYIIGIECDPGTIQGGELVQQVVGQSNTTTLTVDTDPNFTIGEIVYTGANLQSSTGSGIVYSINTASNTVTLTGTTGVFANSNTIVSFITGETSNVIAQPLVITTTPAARGVVTGITAGDNGDYVITVSRLSVPSFIVSGNVMIDVAGNHTANILSVAPLTSSLPIGMNANVIANTIVSGGSISAIEVADSGFGYPNNTIVTIVGEGVQANGVATAYVDSYGVGAGYYRNSKGFLSSDKYLHDGDFYQEYSYQVLTRMSFDKYADIFKKVMHVSGTKVFGDVVIQDTSSVIMTARETTIVEE